MATKVDIDARLAILDFDTNISLAYTINVTGKFLFLKRRDYRLWW